MPNQTKTLNRNALPLPIEAHPAAAFRFVGESGDITKGRIAR